MIADKGDNKGQNSRPITVVTTPPGTLNFSALTSSGDRRRRKAICDSRIIIHTHTVAKVAVEAITVKTFSGMM